MEKEKMESASADETKKPIFIKDNGQPLALWPKEINGVVVYIPTPEKSRELNERFDKGVAPRELRSTRRRK